MFASNALKTEVAGLSREGYLFTGIRRPHCQNCNLNININNNSNIHIPTILAEEHTLTRTAHERQPVICVYRYYPFTRLLPTAARYPPDRLSARTPMGHRLRTKPWAQEAYHMLAAASTPALDYGSLPSKNKSRGLNTQYQFSRAPSQYTIVPFHSSSCPKPSSGTPLLALASNYTKAS